MEMINVPSALAPAESDILPGVTFTTSADDLTFGATGGAADCGVWFVGVEGDVLQLEQIRRVKVPPRKSNGHRGAAPERNLRPASAGKRIDAIVFLSPAKGACRKNRISPCGLSDLRVSVLKLQ